MKLSKEIKSLRGESFRQAVFIQEEINKLPKGKDGKPDLSGISNENVENVILNCLALYQEVTSAKEGFYVNTIANLILTKEKDEIELQSKFRKFLIEVLESSIMRTETVTDGDKEVKKQKGIYSGWIISQVLSELGVTVNEEGEIVY